MHDGGPDGPEPIEITRALDGVVTSLRGPSRAAVGGVFGRWSEIVGEQVAAHVTPAKLDRDVLVVDVDDPAWATQVRLLTGTIIERVREVAGTELTRVDVSVVPPKR